VEVTFQTALNVADMSPAAMDARITQPEVGQIRVDGADLISDRRTNLATVRHIADVGWANQRIILSATTGYTACGRSSAFYKSLAPGGIGDRSTTVRCIDTDVGLAGINYCAHIDDVVGVWWASNGYSAQIGR
jgi:hypothetical protein